MAMAAAAAAALPFSRVNHLFPAENEPLAASGISPAPRGWRRSIVVAATRSRGRKTGEEDGGRYEDSAGRDPPEASTRVNGVSSSAAFNTLQDLGQRYVASSVSKQRLGSIANVRKTTSNKQPGDDEDDDDEDVEEELKRKMNAKKPPEKPKVVDKNDPSFNLELGEFPASTIKEPRFRLTLAELLDEAKVVPLSVQGDMDVIITGIQHDSRQVNPGDMFVCCEGKNVDGHKFAAQAAQLGAVVVVASKEVEMVDNVRAIVMVSETNSILSALAGAFYGHPSDSLAVVGITGTNGKTTTSYLVRSIYECMGLKTGLIGTIAYYVHGKQKIEDAALTTPDAIHLQKLMATMVHNDSEVCVMEVSSHALALDRCRAVDFDVAVFTNLSRDHFDFHGDMESYREAKGKLFSSMVDPARHRKVVNADDPNAGYFASLGSPHVPVISFGMGKTADVHPLEVELTLFETNLVVKTPRGNLEISSGLLGSHNVYNILAAVSVGIAVDAPLEEIVRGIEEVDTVPGRVELVDEEQPFAVIVDYAHTPDALSRLLDTVRECGAKRIITVVGCGGDRDRGKRPMMAKIAAAKSDVCIFTNDNPRTEDPLEILDDMLAGVGWSIQEYFRCGERNYYPPIWNGNRVYIYDLRKIAVRAAVAMGLEGDAVVIAGKGHEKYQIVGTEKKYHDDREECREALLQLDMLHASGIDASEIPWKIPGHTL